MKKKLRAAIRNPLVIILPIVALALWGWNMYVAVAHAPNHAQNNILPNGSFEDLDAKGVPHGWQVKGNHGIGYATQQARGFKGGTAFGLQIDKGEYGSADFKSPVMPVRAHATYLHKGYFKSTAKITLLVKYFNKDGSNKLYLFKTYEPSSEWTTESVAFKTTAQTERVQIVYRLTENGTVWFDKAYLEQKESGVHVSESITSNRPNLIANGAIATVEANKAKRWLPYVVGETDAQLSVAEEDGVQYLRSRITKHKSGEAKWVPVSVGVKSGQAFTFSVDYRSDTQAAVIAEFVLNNKGRVFTRIMSLPPAGTWTTVSAQFEAPSQSQEVTVNVVLDHKGTVDTDNYMLQDVTRTGARHFKQPMVSLAFDNGWIAHSIAERVLGYLGYKATFYINPETVGSVGYFGKKDLMRMQKTGHQLASQGNEPVDLTMLNAPQMSRHMQTADDYFEEELNTSSVDFAPPKRKTDPELQSLAYQYYRSARGPEQGINTKQSFDAYNIKSVQVDNQTTPAAIKAVLNETKKEKGWLVLTYDKIQDNSPDSTAVTSKAFTEQIDLIHKSNIPVKTVESALNEIWSE